VPTSYDIRAARPDDYDTIIPLVDEWWGRPIAGALQRVFLDHFYPTSLVAEAAENERGRRLVGFLVGFPSPADDSTAYIHFVGVDPQNRGDGLGRTLYERFFAAMRALGRTEVHAVTGPVNVASIAFHRSMGFSASAPVADYDGPGADRVVFTRAL
jgi:ribosomal protein S18 acetylase RimI-like enzyme